MCPVIVLSQDKLNHNQTVIMTTESVITSPIIQFVRETRGKNKGQPRGIVYANVINGKFYVGWSYTNIKSGDKFSKEKALTIAINRMTSPPRNKITPRPVIKVISNVFDQFHRRYKSIGKIEDL